MEGNTTHTSITSYSYGTLRLKKGPNQLGLIFSTLHIYFIHYFLLISYSLRDIYYICPRFFYFHNSYSQLLFATHFRDSILKLPFVTPFATHCFATNLSCDSTTDGRTVSTPQHHLPIIPTLTLKTFLGTILYSLASPSSYYPPPCPPPLVDLCLLTLPLAHPLLHRPLPPLPGPLTPSPHLSPPLPLPPFPLYGNMSLQV